MKTLYIECKMGAAGDMLQAALYELLDEEQKEYYTREMNQLFPDAISLCPQNGSQCGIAGTRMQVLIHGHEEHAGEDGHAHHAETSCEPVHEHHGHEEIHDHGHEHEDIHEHHHDHEHGHEHEHEDMHEHHHDHEHIHEHHHDYEDMHDHEYHHDHEDIHDHEHEHEHYHEYECMDEHEHHHDHSHSHTHAHYSYPEVCSRLHSLPLPQQILSHAEVVYRLIGDAEAKAHHSTIEQIHFHEVGSLDAIADVVGVCLLISLLQPEKILASPVHVGNGTVRCAHGVLPVPAPATAEILKGVPYYTGDIMSELCTPTGAALLKHFTERFCSMPVMSIEKTGIGLGTKVFPVANMVRVFLGDTVDGEGLPGNSGTSDQILEVSCNIDDMTGEELGYAMDALLTAGALDVFYQPIYMKKNRPAVMLNCFCNPDEKEKFALLILKLTSTRGVRFQAFSRMKLESHFEEESTPWGPVRKKVSSGYGIMKSKYEYEDLKRIAKTQGISPAAVRDAIEKTGK